jgi:hypothetical protein
MKTTLPFPFRLCLAAASLLCAAAPSPAKPAFTELLHNPAWYRTYDTNSSIIPSEGTLLYAWHFEDAAKAADSFFVGIDTLWGIPQDVGGDTAADWDLQVCPDEICMNGLKAGIHGADSPYPFGDTNFKAEHHFQFFPAVDPGFNFTSPPGAVFGAMMFCRSRSTGEADTVFAFGAWKLKWDPKALPPVRPVSGYLPGRSDFAVSGDTVRYLKAGSGIPPRSSRMDASVARLRVRGISGGLRLSISGVLAGKRLSIHGSDGSRIWSSGVLPAGQSELTWHPGGTRGSGASGFVYLRLSWPGGESWAKAILLSP